MKGVWSKRDIYYYITERSVFGSENMLIWDTRAKDEGYIFFLKF